jgi:signal transduction histidine kinase
MTTNTILEIGVAVFTVFAVVQIIYLLGLIKAVAQMATFFKRIEDNVNLSLVELRPTIENLKKITDDARAVTSDVREISSTVTTVEREIRSLITYIKEGVGPAVEANIAGLQAGIKTGVVALVKNLHEGRSDDHDRAG